MSERPSAENDAGRDARIVAHCVNPIHVGTGDHDTKGACLVPNPSVFDVPVWDSRGRDTRIHGLVLDEGNPGPTLRELLRQWSTSGLTPPGDLAERTAAVLEAIGPDGTSVIPPAKRGGPHSLTDCWCGEHHAREDFL